MGQTQTAGGEAGRPNSDRGLRRSDGYIGRCAVCGQVMTVRDDGLPPLCSDACEYKFEHKPVPGSREELPGDENGATGLPSAEVSAGWIWDDRWLFRRLGLEAPQKLPTKEVLRFEEIAFPDRPGVSIQLSMLGLSTGEKMIAAIIRSANGFLYDFVARTKDLRDLWPTIELIASGAVVTFQAGGSAKRTVGRPVVTVDQLKAAAAADLPPVSLGQGSYAHGLDGSPSPLDPHSPTQSEVSAARAGGAA